MTVFIKIYVLLFQAKKTELGRIREYFSNDKRAHKHRMGSCENTREFNQSPNLIKVENIEYNKFENNLHFTILVCPCEATASIEIQTTQSIYS